MRSSHSKTINFRFALFAPPNRHLGEQKMVGPSTPPPRIPLASVSIASYVEKHSGIPCYVYCSHDHSTTSLSNFIRDYRPSAIGISCLSFNRFACMELAALVKKIDPFIITILGGVHATYLDRQILSAYPSVDYAVRGEGEVTLCKLLNAISQKRSTTNIAGISLRQGNKIVQTKPRARLASLDDIPLIDFSKFSFAPMEKGPLDHLLHNGLPIETMRGCPFNCLFCSTVGFWGRKVITKSVKNVIRQIRMIPAQHRDLIYFHDMNFTLNKQYMQELCNALIEEKINIPWTCSTRINLVDKPTLQIMKDAGCRTIFYGIDSFARKILFASGRDYEPQLAINNANLTEKMGIQACVNLIVGFPQETETTLRETLFKRNRLHPNVQVHVSLMQIMPGAPLYQLALKEGFEESYWLTDHKEPIPYYTTALPENILMKWCRLIEKPLRTRRP